ncbi:hypothetical protein D3C72_1623710 [compost metagenome]
MGAGEQQLHGIGDFVIAHRHHAIEVLAQDGERLRIGATHGHAVGNLCGDRSIDHFAGGDGVAVGGGTSADHADNAHRVLQGQLGRHCCAGARAQANGHVGRVHIRHGAQKFPPVGADAADQVCMEAGHHVGATLLRQRDGMFACGLKIIAVLDEGGAQGAHGGVLFDGVAVRHHNGAAHAMAARSPGDALAVVAPGGADDFGR